MSYLARLNIVVSTDQARRAMTGLKVTAKKSAAVIQGAFARMQKTIGFVTRQIFSLKAAFLTLGAGFIAADFLRVANTLEQVEFQLNAVTKSQALTNKILGNTRKFATEVSFSFEDLAESAKILTPQLKNNADEVDFFLRASADAAAVTGLTVTEAATQFARMYNAGAASADQFRERGVLAMMGFEQGVTYSIDETRKRLKSAFEEGGSVLAGVAPMMATTLNGALSMIGDKVFELKATIMDAGLFDFIKAAVTVINQDLDKAMTDLKRNGETAGKAITEFLFSAMLSAAGTLDGIVAIGDGVRSFFNNLASFYNNFNSISGGTLAGLGFVGYILFGMKGALIVTLVGALAGVADQLLSWLSGLVKSMLTKLREFVEATGAFGADTVRSYEERSTVGGHAQRNFKRDYPSASVYNDAMKDQGYELQSDGSLARSGFHSDIIGMNAAHKSLTRGIKGASDYETFYEIGEMGFSRAIEDAFAQITGAAGSMAPSMGGSLVKDKSSYLSAAETVVERMRKLMELNTKAAGGANPDATDPSSSTSGKAVSIPEHILQEQLNTVLSKQFDLLADGKITRDEFNKTLEINAALMNKGIPLVGTLTAEQLKEKEGIIALMAAQNEHKTLMDAISGSYMEYGAAFKTGFMEAADAAMDAAARTAEYGKSMYGSLENGLTQFIKNGKINFKQFLLDMVTDFLAAQAKMAMGGLIKSIAMMGGGGGSFLGSFLYGGQAAGGGPVMAGRAYTVGERGRETFVPSTGGRIVPNGQGGGNVSVVQNFDFSNADETVLARLQGASQEIQNQTFSSVFEAIGQGGTYAKASGRR